MLQTNGKITTIFSVKIILWTTKKKVGHGQYTYQPFYIYRRDIFYHKSTKIFRRGPIISEDARRRSEDFRLTLTQEHKGTLTFLLKKESSEKVDHPHRLFFSLFGSGLFK